LIFMHALQKRILGIYLVSFACDHGKTKGTTSRSESFHLPWGTPNCPAPGFDGPAAMLEVLPANAACWEGLDDFLCFFLKRYFIRVIWEGRSVCDIGPTITTSTYGCLAQAVITVGCERSPAWRIGPSQLKGLINTSSPTSR
jgi:hypothetical protein